MGDTHLSHDEFFTKLAKLLEAQQKNAHGSVYLTQKRMSHGTFPAPSQEEQERDPLWDTRPPHPLPIIIRATDGKSQTKDRTKNNEKAKLSTIVEADQMEKFFERYGEVCKAGIAGLKKRDRSKRKKGKGKKKNNTAA